MVIFVTKKDPHHFVGLSIRDVLGFSIDIPFFSKLSSHLESTNPRISVDTKLLLIQHATTGSKIAYSIYFLNQMKQYADFTKFFGTNVKKDVESNAKHISDFQMSLECFLLFAQEH